MESSVWRTSYLEPTENVLEVNIPNVNVLNGLKKLFKWFNRYLQFSVNWRNRMQLVEWIEFCFPDKDVAVG